MKTAHKSQWIRLGVLLLIEILLGAALGALFGEDMLIRQARSEAHEFATRLVDRADALGKEANTVLSAVSQGAHPRFEPCSEADLAFMDGLLLGTNYIKDIGRIQNNAFLCTSLHNRIPNPRPLAASPTFVEKDGHAIYKDLPGLVGSSHTSAIVYQNAGVLIDDLSLFNFPQSPMRYTTFSVDFDRKLAIPIFGTPSALPVDKVLSQSQGQFDGRTYASVCSSSYPMCAAAYISGDDLMQGHRSILWASAAFGALFGVLIALTAIVFFRSQSTLVNQLQKAVRRGELFLAYQPVVELPSGRFVGAEALVRWHPASGEQINPDVFIPIAERSGFIGEITRLVIKRAISELGPLLQQFPDLHIAVNFAAPDLADPAVLNALDRSLEISGIPPSAIVVELTERITGDRQVAQKAITQLRRRGHIVFIDDFGTGYSSLAYLSELNVDGMKLDRSFTSSVGTGAVTAAIVPQILAMAAALNLMVVVEGIETEAQVQYFSHVEQAGKLTQDGRPMLGQGWYFSRPLSPEAFTQRVLAQRGSQNPLLDLPQNS